MARLVAIWDRAKAALTIAREDGREDHVLWEQSARIATTAGELCKLREVEAMRPDEVAVAAASLFHNAAWALYVNDELVDPGNVLLLAVRDDHFQKSATEMMQQLESMLSPESLRRARDAIMALQSRELDTPEALVVSDALQLEEFGLSSLWSTIRRGSLEAQTIKSVIERWRRRAEYHYWTARLDESFHFDTVRQLARKRLERLGRVIDELEAEQSCRDLWTDH